jgi:hypothetical protein
MTHDVLEVIAQEYPKGRRLLVQATNIDAQRPVIWDFSAIAASRQPDRRDLIQVLLASSALPSVSPVWISARAEGRRYDELHVDGGVTAQLFARPRTWFARFEEMAFGSARERTLYVIRNGKLMPDYKPTEESAFPLAVRSIATMTKYEGLFNLRRLDHMSCEANPCVLFTSISSTFTQAARSEFDREYMSELFLVGEQLGESGQVWRSRPLLEPALVL